MAMPYTVDLTFTKKKKRTKSMPEDVKYVARNNRGEWIAYNGIPDGDSEEEILLGRGISKQQLGVFKYQTEKEFYDVVSYEIVD